MNSDFSSNQNSGYVTFSTGRGPIECGFYLAKTIPIFEKECKKNKIKLELIEITYGDKKTIRSAVFAFENPKEINTFWQQWIGSIKWIGKSKFRPNHKRKNWFLDVSQLNKPNNTKFSLKPNEIKIETFRSSGAGGQHVNKTNSAVRITHLKTNLQAISQDERSQTQNKKIALLRLEHLLLKQKQQADEKLQQQIWQKHNDLERGNAVRVFIG